MVFCYYVGEDDLSYYDNLNERIYDEYGLELLYPHDIERINELGSLIDRNMKWLYERTPREYEDDELQMLVSEYIIEMFGILKMAPPIEIKNQINNGRRVRRSKFKKIYVNSDPVQMTPSKWKSKIRSIYGSDFELFAKEHKGDIAQLRSPDKFENFSAFLEKVNMVEGGFNFVLQEINALRKDRDMLRDELNEAMEIIENGKINYNNPHNSRRKPITKSIRHEVFVRDNYTCIECGATNKQTRLHVDHILPVAQGGTDEMSNLQTLCEACNLAKSNRAWVAGRYEETTTTTYKERIDYSEILNDARKERIALEKKSLKEIRTKKEFEKIFHSIKWGSAQFPLNEDEDVNRGFERMGYLLNMEAVNNDR